MSKAIVYKGIPSQFKIPDYSKYNQAQFKLQISAGVGNPASYTIPQGFYFYVTAVNLTGKTDVNNAGGTFNTAELDIDISATGGAVRSLLVTYATVNTSFYETLSFPIPIKVNSGEIIILRYGATSINTYSQANVFGYLEPTELQQYS